MKLSVRKFGRKCLQSKKLMAIATNLDAEERDALSVLENVPFFELDNAECIAEFILSDYFR
ncbi:MAG: hypothetical protein ACLTAF_03165 [Blautia coccoides]